MLPASPTQTLAADHHSLLHNQPPKLDQRTKTEDIGGEGEEDITVENWDYGVSIMIIIIRILTDLNAAVDIVRVNTGTRGNKSSCKPTLIIVFRYYDDP